MADVPEPQRSLNVPCAPVSVPAAAAGRVRATRGSRAAATEGPLAVPAVSGTGLRQRRALGVRLHARHVRTGRTPVAR